MNTGIILLVVCASLFAMLIYSFYRISQLKNYYKKKERYKIYKLKSKIGDLTADLNAARHNLQVQTVTINKQSHDIKRYDELLGESIPLRLTEQRMTGRTTRLAFYYLEIMIQDENHETILDKLEPCDTCSEEHMRNELINKIREQAKFFHRLKVKVLDGGKKLKLAGVNDMFMKAQNKAKALNIYDKVQDVIKKSEDE